MGMSGWLYWLSSSLDKLKTLRSMTKDAEQIKIIDEIIADLESKKAGE